MRIIILLIYLNYLKIEIYKILDDYKNYYNLFENYIFHQNNILKVALNL